MEIVSFGEWLKRRRKGLGLTQEELARKINSSTITLRKIEAAERRPSLQIAKQFAQIFNVPVKEQADFLRFARDQWRSTHAEVVEDGPWNTSTKSHRSNLPITPTSVIGREQDIVIVREYLADPNIRLVTLIGPPGIGKTRLSLEASRASISDFIDGIFFVALAPLEDPALVIPSIINSLGYVEPTSKLAINYLADGIGDKQILLVLDNCEHLIEEIAPLVSGLLSACSRLKVLVTSRESLRIPGEWLYSVPSLALPQQNFTIDPGQVSQFPALMLFSERARAVRSDFVINADNIQVVTSICLQLDGIPLAIELIAARIRLMSPQALLERLNDQFVMSANGMRAPTSRQKTLQDAIGWSFNLLSLEEQKLFAYLSIFHGGFTLEAAESIFSRIFVNKPVRDLVALLLDKSLIRRTLDEKDEVRYDMLVTIHQFALNRLQSMGSESEMYNLHLSYFFDLAEKADKEAHGPNQIEWMDRLTNEQDNYRAALQRCFSSQQTEVCLQLFNTLTWTWNVRWSWNEELDWFDRILAMPGVDKYAEPCARMLNNAGLRKWRMGNYDEARSVLEKSLAIWLQLGRRGELGQAEALNRLGMVANWGDKDTNKAESYFNQSLTLFQKAEEPWGIAWNLFHLGGIAINRRQSEVALSLLQQSFDLYRELGDPWGMGRVSQFLGVLYLKQADYKKAQFYFDQQLKYDESLRFLDGVSMALLNLGELYRFQGDYAQAEVNYERSLKISREHGMKIDIGANLYNLGLLALQQNDYSEALRFFNEYFKSVRTANGNIATRNLFIGLAAVAAGTNQPERAAKLSGAAQAIFDTTDNLFSPFDRAVLDRHIQVSRNDFGKEAFDVLVMEGRQMFVEQALAYALAE